MDRPTAATATFTAPRARACALALAMAVALLPASALAISRTTVLTRAQHWVDYPVPYSQLRYHDGYRTDCSGYVSACWSTGRSYSTRSFYLVTSRIDASQLQPGDAMLKKGYHIRLFYAWLDPAHKSYVAYEAGSSTVALTRIHALREDLVDGYVPVRYRGISGSAASDNLLKNGKFDVWARDWSSAPEDPVWWETGGGSSWDTLALRRRDVYRSGRNCLQLVNPDSNPSTYAELSQVVSMGPSAAYELAAWARSVTGTSSVQLRVSCLDAAGSPLSDKRVSAQVGNRFSPVSATLFSPRGTAAAVVTLRLAGGSTPDATGAPVPGTTVLFDDVSLVRPKAAVTIGLPIASGTAVTVAGSVTPTSAIAHPITVYVLRPGDEAWEARQTRIVAAPSGGAVWSLRLSLAHGAPKGVYYFKARVPSAPEYAGAVSRVVSFTFR